jgi:RNA polymerase sigma-70 factor (ECF subfamily)
MRREEKRMPAEAFELILVRSIALKEQPPEQSDAILRRLVERAKARDGGAFDELMLRHQRKVLGTALKMLGNMEDARDATQEAFLKVYKYLDSYNSAESFAAWLYRIVINVCFDVRRKRPVAGQVISYESEAERGAVDGLAAGCDLETRAIQSQQRELVEKALATLPPKERAAIVLRDLEDLSTEEVARILGSSPSTVRAQISSGRTKIKLYRDRMLKQRRS